MQGEFAAIRMTDLEVENPTIEDLELLVEVSQLFTLHELEDVLRTVVNLAARAVGATDASLVLFEDNEIDRQHIINIREDDPERATEIAERIVEQGLAGWAANTHEIALVEDTLEDPRWHPLPDDAYEARSALCIPLIYQSEVLAVTTAIHPEPGHFSAHHLRLMTIISNQAAVAIHNARLFKQMRTHQRQLEIMLHAIPDALLILDENGYILLTNEAALPLLGAVSETEATDQYLTDMPSTDASLDTIKEIISEAADDPFGGQTNLAFEIRSEELKRDFQVIMTTWKDQQQDHSGYVVIVHDITTLRDLHRFKDQMLRLASHDLKSPLALIVGYADMVKVDTPDPESPVHEYADAILQSTTRMYNLLESLLRVEQIRSSPLELHEQVDPQQVAERVLADVGPIAAQKGLTLESRLNFSDEAISIDADPILIQQAMENLVENAIKYTRAGGHIRVYAGTDAGRFDFVVEDTGMGIPAESLPHVFESFYRVTQPGMEGIKGSGLGLSLVKEVIERHGGEVWAESEPGEGSRFGFWLPPSENH